MPNITQVTLTNGLPTSGSGNVSTIDALLTSGMPISGNVALAGGTNQIGNVSVSNGTVTISGNVALAVGTNQIGNVSVTSGTVLIGAGSSQIGNVSVTSGTVLLGAGSSQVGNVSVTSGAVSLTNIGFVPGTTNTVMVSTDGIKKTYRYAVISVVPATNPTDLIRMIGSGTATVRVKHISIYAKSGVDDRIACQLIKYSTLGTVGANAVYNYVTPMKHDNNDAGASANVSYVTNANPAVTGTVVAVGGVGLLCVGPANPPGAVCWNYCVNQDKAVVLRGTSDILTVNFNGGSIANDVVFSFEIETEEDNS